MTTTYQVIEDNAGGMFLFFWVDAKLVIGIENIEHAEPGDLNTISMEDAETWDGQLENPEELYSFFLADEFGSRVVADNAGVYPENMGRAAQRVYGVDSD